MRFQLIFQIIFYFKNEKKRELKIRKCHKNTKIEDERRTRVRKRNEKTFKIK
jgi:hypothetical protein